MKQYQEDAMKMSQSGTTAGQQNDQDGKYQDKVKEVYNLTVELGCLKEENNELHKVTEH